MKNHSFSAQALVAGLPLTTRATCKALCALLGAVAMALPLRAIAADEAATPSSAGFHRMQLGAFTVTALSDGSVVLPIGDLVLPRFRERTLAALARSRLNGNVETSVNAFLIDTGGMRVLVDAGDPPGLRPGLGHLAANLRAAGYTPEQVDAVLITHMHRDHVGGLVTGGAATFPNAQVWIERREAQYWLSEAEKARAPKAFRSFFDVAMAAVRPYREGGRLHLFSAGDAIPIPGVRALQASGHTPGHVAFLVESADERLLLWGDLVHIEAIQFAQPEVGLAFDVDGQAAAEQRKELFEQAVTGCWWVGAAHLAFPGIGRVKDDNEGYAWVPVAQAAHGEAACRSGRVRSGSSAPR